MENLKDKFEFYWPLDKPIFRISVTFGGISKTAGHNGYKTTIYGPYKMEKQEPLAKFIVELNGNLYKENEQDKKIVEMFNDYDLGKVVINEAKISN
jgi:hypothetical protein